MTRSQNYEYDRDDTKKVRLWYFVKYVIKIINMAASIDVMYLVRCVLL